MKDEDLDYWIEAFHTHSKLPQSFPLGHKDCKEIWIYLVELKERRKKYEDIQTKERERKAKI